MRNLRPRLGPQDQPFFGQSSDSSARYEKGVDFHSPQLGLARALHLIQELDCGDITTLEFDCTDGRSDEPKVITTTPEKICAVLGIGFRIRP